MPDKKTCFIIMPLTTPDAFVSQFKGDNKHFLHVLENIFIPAIEKAGFNPIKPIAKGSDLIQAEIIKNLNEVDLVLCDMSILNPNVFFEYGIRTALNKPVCVVKDHLTQSIPFDTAIINYHNYSAELNAWEITSEIERLSKHISESYERNPTDNNLWKYFGLSTRVKFDVSQVDQKDKLELILIELNSLKDTLANIYISRNREFTSLNDPINNFEERLSWVVEAIKRNLMKQKIESYSISYGVEGIKIELFDDANDQTLKILNDIAYRLAIRIKAKIKHEIVLFPSPDFI